MDSLKGKPVSLIHLRRLEKYLEGLKLPEGVTKISKGCLMDISTAVHGLKYLEEKKIIEKFVFKNANYYFLSSFNLREFKSKMEPSKYLPLDKELLRKDKIIEKLKEKIQNLELEKKMLRRERENSKRIINKKRCNFCDSTQIYYRRKSHDWSCSSCGAVFLQEEDYINAFCAKEDTKSIRRKD